MNDRFKYQKFRKPIAGEKLSSFFYEFYQHLEAEFERLTEYILSKEYETKGEQNERKGNKMNDRFKFRLYDKKIKEMIYADTNDEFLPYYPDEIYTILQTYDLSAIENLADNEDYIVMQCTGLKDKNGKLIFEGDVVNQNNTIYSVNWCDGSFCFKDALNGKNYTVEFVMSAKLEVIGNIYENKELLNEN